MYFCNILRMYHPDCVQDYVPAEVLAHAVALAAAAAAGGGGGGMVTHDVSLDEPVSQLCFYRMVQAAVQRLPAIVLCQSVTLCMLQAAAAQTDAAAAAFGIRLGRSALGWLGGVLYHMAVALGAKVLLLMMMMMMMMLMMMMMTTTTAPPAAIHWQLQVAGDLHAEGEFSSAQHFASSGRAFSCKRSTQPLVHKYGLSLRHERFFGLLL